MCSSDLITRPTPATVGPTPGDESLSVNAKNWQELKKPNQLEKKSGDGKRKATFVAEPLEPKTKDCALEIAAPVVVSVPPFKVMRPVVLVIRNRPAFSVPEFNLSVPRRMSVAMEFATLPPSI